jgi:hypothetical protein
MSGWQGGRLTLARPTGLAVDAANRGPTHRRSFGKPDYFCNSFTRFFRAAIVAGIGLATRSA